MIERGPEFERKEIERRHRRLVFHRAFGALLVLVTGFLLWKLRGLMLPIVIGALLAYLFRPVKERFRLSWMPHELRVITLFAAIGFVLFSALNGIRTHFPNERDKLVLKVRLKYKVNEKFQQLAGGPAEKNPIRRALAQEAAPAMDQVNRLLALSKDEKDLFLLYRQGYDGLAPIEDKYFDYFQASETTTDYEKRDPSSIPDTAPTLTAKVDAHAGGEKTDLKSELEAWVLAPLIFLFLGFDHGQMRRYFIGLIPNRYFELSLTVMDILDDAIGLYLRGTLLECTLVGVTLTVGFLLLGMPASVAIAIGVISGLANAIPFLGTVIGLFIGLGYALIAEGVTPILPGLSPDDLAVYVVILIAITHVLDNIIYQPFVLGSAVNLHPLVVVIAIIGGSLLAGLWGMFLAIPTVVVLKTAVETLFRELKAYRII